MKNREDITAAMQRRVPVAATMRKAALDHEPGEKNVQLMVYLPESLHKEFKIHAVVVGRSMSDICRELISAHLEASKN